MNLSEAGEARIRGYLYLLRQSLRSFMPSDMVTDSVREVESHVRERLDELGEEGAERERIERTLKALGPPLELARVYAAEVTIDEAVTTGRAAPLLRALWVLAATTIGGFWKAFLIFLGYLAGLAFCLLAVLKPIFPDNVGLVVKDGIPVALGAIFPLPEGSEVVGGYWLVPVFLAGGMLILLITHRAARKALSGVRGALKSQLAPREAPGPSGAD